MKAHYRTANGRLTFELQAEDTKGLFRQISEVQEVYDAESACGLCGCTALRYLARKVEDYDFYELACTNMDCRATFEFGQKKKGGALFPKRKDDDGRFLPSGGWSRYVPAGQQQPEPAAAGRPQTPPPARDDSRDHRDHRSPQTGPQSPPPAAPSSVPGPTIPEEIAGVVARVKRNPREFGEAAKLFEAALVRKWGAEEGIRRYDAVAEEFYKRHPNGTLDTAELVRIMLALHAEIDRPADSGR